MIVLIKTTLLGLFFGMFGTTIGGIIGVKLKIKSNRLLSFVLEFASGLMTAIICFELIPESLEISNMVNSIWGLLLGAISMIYCDNIVNIKFKKQKNTLLKTGLIVGIGLAIHNFPEGLAIGSGFGASVKLGYALAIAIAFHDIPEGISMSVPMKSGGMNNGKVILYTMISGITTGIGAFFRSDNRKCFQKSYRIFISFCGRSNVIYCFRRINSRIKEIISRKIWRNRKYNWIYNWIVCYEHLAKIKRAVKTLDAHKLRKIKF